MTRPLTGLAGDRQRQNRTLRVPRLSAREVYGAVSLGGLLLLLLLIRWLGG